jgi:DNA-binding GntR family transcriptional regulator
MARMTQSEQVSAVPAMNGAPITTRVASANYREQAFAILREQLLDGRYSPGSRLNEVEIAEAMGISRGPLREALQRLVAEGLVEVVPNRGAFVRAFSSVELRHMYEFRDIVEAGAASLAARRATPDDVAHLRAMLTTTAELIDLNAGIAYPESPDFHRRILELSGNPSLLRTGTELQTQVRFARQSSGRQPGRARAALDDHAAIVDAIERHDPVAAQDAMTRHLAGSLASISHTYLDGTPDHRPLDTTNGASQ